jgi:hypothetical protein
VSKSSAECGVSEKWSEGGYGCECEDEIA